MRAASAPSGGWCQVAAPTPLPFQLSSAPAARVEEGRLATGKSRRYVSKAAVLQAVACVCGGGGACEGMSRPLVVRVGTLACSPSAASYLSSLPLSYLFPRPVSLFAMHRLYLDLGRAQPRCGSAWPRPSLLFSTPAVCPPLSMTAVNRMIGPWLVALSVHGTCGLRTQIEKQLVVVAGDCISATRVGRTVGAEAERGLTCARLTGWCLLLLALVIRWLPPSPPLPSPWPS